MFQFGTRATLFQNLNQWQAERPSYNSSSGRRESCRASAPLAASNISNMKPKAITLIVVSLMPLTAFSQPQPPTPPTPPMGPQPPHDREDRRPKVPVTFLGVETSEVPGVL